MTTTSSDFVSAIYQLAEDNGLDRDIVLDVIKNAILTAYKKVAKDEVNPEDDLASYSIDIDEESGEFIVLADKKVVSHVTDPATQIQESQAKLIDARLREGDHIQLDVTPDNFGRIAAQAAKQRVMQGLRDAVRDTMIDRYKDKVGKIVTGAIQRKDFNNVLIEVERAEAIMPNQEQIPGEFYRSSERKRFLLVRLSNTLSDKRMVLSRSSPDFLKALFELEVPEVASESVEIINIAREPGSRAKVAVQSNHEKVDAIGSCVGPRGTRIDSIMNEVTPEKVDIIQYHETAQQYVINSLSPAKISDIKLDEEIKHAKVLVAEDSLSLAIGKDGQNVRLAAKLTGYKIDITADKSQFEEEVPEEERQVIKEEQENQELTDQKDPIEDAIDKKENPDELDAFDFTERQKELLKENGITTVSQLQEIADGRTEIKGFTKRDTDKIAKQLGG